MKKITNKKKVIVGCIAVAAAVAACTVVCDCRLQISEYTVLSDKLSGNVRIVFLSDLHDSLYGHDQLQLINEIENTIQPDIVIFGGDIADEIKGGVPYNSYTLARKLVQNYPCFYSPGNHEYNRGDIEKIKQTMSDIGVTVLEGDYSEIEVNGNKLHIGGIYSSDYIVEKDGEMLYQLEAAADGDKDCYRILLCHFPEDIDDNLPGDFDLILSGHAHGGQWRLPFANEGLFAPGQGLFPKYTNGIYNFGKTKMLVSRGLWKPHISMPLPRIFNRPEAVVINLKEIG